MIRNENITSEECRTKKPFEIILHVGRVFSLKSWVAKKSCHGQTFIIECSISDYPSNFELRDLEAEVLNLVCKEVETEPVLQEIKGEILSQGTKLISYKMQVLTFTLGAFGKGSDLPILISGYFTQMQNCTSLLFRRRFMLSMETRNNGNMLKRSYR